MDDDLIQHIQDLPPELFNMIKSNVLHHSLPELSADGFRYEHISAAYKYPLPLHLNRGSREQFAKCYYGSIVLVFRSTKLFTKLLSAMEDKHHFEVRGMRVPSIPQLLQPIRCPFQEA
jgi:hypothetical protein